MIKPDLFKLVMRRHAASVVLLSIKAGERVHFMTATSFTPVSLDPPLALFCIHKNNDTHDLVRVGGTVGISLLSHLQEPLSRRFAAKGAERYSIDDLDLVPGPEGAVLLSGACASMEIKVSERHLAGDHSIFVGYITWAAAEADSSPLVYHSGQYASVAGLASAQQGLN
ncbi:MAG: flavin reductase family protein [Bradyrhizobium sp.]|nr:flavin reductase family protein [Bradyrhizobium sp.]